MKIPIVDENDEVIGEEERSIIHKKGILHREVNVWFITPDDKFIFQKRKMDQETHPGLLDSTAGGHVDNKNDSYEKSAEREVLEETGIDVSGQLIFIEKIRSKVHDPVTNLINNKFSSIYAFLFNGEISELEALEGDGFEAYSLREIENLNTEQKKKFISRFISPEHILLFRKIISKNHENKG